MINHTKEGKLGEPLVSFFNENQYSNVAVLVDENTKKHCYSIVKSNLPTHSLVEINSGEQNKNLATCETIWQKLTDAKFDRQSLLVNLGGGVIGDMGGFCAATYKRGIDFINIPTTLLAMVDASVGGKLGIDFGSFKNHIGLFSEPKQVLIDSIFLKTLPANQLKSGFAEVVKHALIADKEHWEYLLSTKFGDMNWSKIIEHSINIKSEIVGKDPFERGLRKVLNFGHTIGHAIESYFLDSKEPLLHGEAVAMGMRAEARLSMSEGVLSEQSFEQIDKYLSANHLPLSLNDDQIASMIELMSQDKKNEGSRTNFTLLKKIGQAEYNKHMASTAIADSMTYCFKK